MVMNVIMFTPVNGIYTESTVILTGCMSSNVILCLCYEMHQLSLMAHLTLQNSSQNWCLLRINIIDKC